MTLSPQTTLSFRAAGLTDISFGIVDGQAVLMDVLSDTYFLLEREDDEHLKALLAKGSALDTDHGLRAAVGLSSPSAAIVHACAESPSGSLADEPIPLAGVFDTLRATRTVRATRYALGREPLATVLDRVLREIISDPASSPRHDTLPATRRFLAARRLVPIRRNCLLDSLSLLQWLGPSARCVSLVFGAKLHPFAAHCWVQFGDLILNDCLENARLFTPVRSIQCSAATL